MKKLLSVLLVLTVFSHCLIITSKVYGEEIVLYVEDFSAADKKTEIQNKQNGWDWYESTVGITDIDILSEKGFVNGLRFSSKDWYKNNELSLDLPVAVGAENAAYLNDNIHISLDALFGISSSQIEVGSQMYMRITDSNGIAFCGLILETDYVFSLVALNASKSNTVKYLISNTREEIIDQKKQYDFYINPNDNTFRFLVDGVPLESVTQVHGSWIPTATRADVGPASVNNINGVGGIIIGHSWSTWWNYIIIDNLQLSDFVIQEPEEFIIKNATIIQKGTDNTVIREGMTPYVNFETAGGELSEHDTHVAWYYSVNGLDFLPMETEAIPVGTVALKAEITALSTEGEEATATVTVPVEKVQAVNFHELYHQNFEGANIQASILAKEDGWNYGGSNYGLDVSGFGESGNSLRHSSREWYKNSWLKLDFLRAGVTVPNSNIYFRSDLMFGTSTQDNYDEDGKMYFKLQDSSERNIIELSIVGYNLNFVHGGKNYRLATGRDNVFEKWNKVELFIDSNRKVFTFLFNDEPIEIATGSQIPFSGSALSNILTEHNWSNFWSYICVDNIELKTYEITENATFDIESISVMSVADESHEITTGATVKGLCETSGSPLGSVAYTWEYSADNIAWSKITGNTIPDNATKLKVIATAYSIYGQQRTMEKIVDVIPNRRPSLSNVKLNGSILGGNIVTVTYHFDDDQDDDNTVFSWYWGDDTLKYTKIANASGKSFTIPEENPGKYLKVVIHPIDKFGLSGAAAERILASDERALVDGAGYLLSIDIEPDGNIIDLPSSSDVFDADIYWHSSNTNYISHQGIINRPSYGDENIVLTAVIVPSGKPNSYAVSHTKKFKVRIVGSNGTKAPSLSGGGGGSTSAGNAVSIAVPPIIHLPEKTSLTYNDITEDFWGYHFIQALASKDIIDKSAENFRPNDFVTRAEFAKMLILSLSVLDDEAQCTYTDINVDHWAYQYIATADSLGIVSGFSDGSFGAEQYISRQDMAVMLSRAIKTQQLSEQEHKIEFIDSADISAYAKDSVADIARKEIMTGNENYFKPLDNATRAECAKVIYIIMKK